MKDNVRLSYIVIVSIGKTYAVRAPLKCLYCSAERMNARQKERKNKTVISSELRSNEWEYNKMNLDTLIDFNCI